ncbi:MAG: TonB-dependent receptor [Bacteroidetes bacterium]|nr:TonB-dependent receptor [Bacteroidota bacterium]
METILSLHRNKTKITVAKQILSVLLTILLFASQSYAQFIQQRNRSVWTTPPKPDTVSHQEQILEEDTSSAKHLEELVVTATRTEKKLDDIGRSVSVISADDIKNSGANSLAELLSLAEGIYITGVNQNFGANQSLFIRGANSNQSVVLIDGIPISDPSTPTGSLELSELSLSDIDRVEIVRGSHSTLYGSSAIGGVVNIITNKKMKQGLSINAAGTAGTFGEETSLISENIGLNYTCKGGFYFRLNLDNVNVNGIDATIDTSTIPGIQRDRDGMNRFDYGGKLGYKSNRWDIFVSKKSVEKNADIDDREFDDDDNYTLDFTRDMVSYSVSCKVDSGFTISINGGKSSLIRTSLNDSSLVDNMGNYDKNYYKGIYTGETFTNELQLQLKQKTFNVVLGGGSNDQTMNQQIYSYSSGFVWESNLDSLNLASRTNSFFLLADLNGEIISEKAKAFSLSLGARSNKNNTFGSSATYQFNPMIKISATSSLYINISSGYNAPSLYQLHSPDKDFTSSISRGNVNLRPETSITKELGVSQKINDNTGIRIAYYRTVVSDIIEYVYLWDKNIGIDTLGNDMFRNDYRGDTYLNLGTLTTEGIELEAHGSIGKKFLMAGNFSYLRGYQDFSANDIDWVKTDSNHVQLYTNGAFLTNSYRADGLTRRPVTANISLTYSPSSKVFFKTICKYVSKRNDVYYDYMLGPYGALGKTPVQAYTLVDLISGVKFNQNVSALLHVENIFNVSYSEIRGFSSRGRGFYLSINYTF